MSNSLATFDYKPLDIASFSTAGPSQANEIGQRFMMAHQIAGALMHATLIPDHLRGERRNVSGTWQLVPFQPQQVLANVMMVVNRALQWGVDPVALIGESFVVGGKLDFQGKVIIAVVNELGGLQQNLSFKFFGEGEGLTVRVVGLLKGETEPRTIELAFKDAVTKDKQGKANEQWTKDIESKLAYSGAKKWARRHTPGVVLGLFGDEEELTPAATALLTQDVPATGWRVSKSAGSLLVASFESEITNAADRGQLKDVVEIVKSHADLTDEEKEFLVSMAKMVWRRKPESPVAESMELSDEKNQDPVLNDKALHYESMINESDSPETLDKWMIQIEADKDLPEDWKDSLLKFAKDRHRQGFVATA